MAFMLRPAASWQALIERLESMVDADEQVFLERTQLRLTEGWILTGYEMERLEHLNEKYPVG